MTTRKYNAPLKLLCGGPFRACPDYFIGRMTGRALERLTRAHDDTMVRKNDLSEGAMKRLSEEEKER